MRSNCERHPHLARTYIAYDATGYAFRVTGQRGNWMARPSHVGKTTDYRLFLAPTLGEAADKVKASRFEGKLTHHRDDSV